MLTLAVVDDIAAIGIIAVFYTDSIDLAALAFAALFLWGRSSWRIARA